MSQAVRRQDFDKANRRRIVMRVILGALGFIAVAWLFLLFLLTLVPA